MSFFPSSPSRLSPGRMSPCRIGFGLCSPTRSHYGTPTSCDTFERMHGIAMDKAMGEQASGGASSQACMKPTSTPPVTQLTPQVKESMEEAATMQAHHLDDLNCIQQEADERAESARKHHRRIEHRLRQQLDAMLRVRAEDQLQWQVLAEQLAGAMSELKASNSKVVELELQIGRERARGPRVVERPAPEAASQIQKLEGLLNASRQKVRELQRELGDRQMALGKEGQINLELQQKLDDSRRRLLTLQGSLADSASENVSLGQAVEAARAKSALAEQKYVAAAAEQEDTIVALREEVKRMREQRDRFGEEATVLGAKLRNTRKRAACSKLYGALHKLLVLRRAKAFSAWQQHLSAKEFKEHLAWVEDCGEREAAELTEALRDAKAQLEDEREQVVWVKRSREKLAQFMVQVQGARASGHTKEAVFYRWLKGSSDEAAKQTASVVKKLESDLERVGEELQEALEEGAELRRLLEEEGERGGSLREEVASQRDLLRLMRQESLARMLQEREREALLEQEREHRAKAEAAARKLEQDAVAAAEVGRGSPVKQVKRARRGWSRATPSALRADQTRSGSVGASAPVFEPQPWQQLQQQKPRPYVEHTERLEQHPDEASLHDSEEEEEEEEEEEGFGVVQPRSVQCDLERQQAQQVQTEEIGVPSGSRRLAWEMPELEVHAEGYEWAAELALMQSKSDLNNLPRLLQSLRVRISEELYLVLEKLFRCVEADYREIRDFRPQPLTEVERLQFSSILHDGVQGNLQWMVLIFLRTYETLKALLYRPKNAAHGKDRGHIPLPEPPSELSCMKLGPDATPGQKASATRILRNRLMSLVEDSKDLWLQRRRGVAPPNPRKSSGRSRSSASSSWAKGGKQARQLRHTCRPGHSAAFLKCQLCMELASRGGTRRASLEHEARRRASAYTSSFLDAGAGPRRLWEALEGDRFADATAEIDLDSIEQQLWDLAMLVRETPPGSVSKGLKLSRQSMQRKMLDVRCMELLLLYLRTKLVQEGVGGEHEEQQKQGKVEVTVRGGDAQVVSNVRSAIAVALSDLEAEGEGRRDCMGATEEEKRSGKGEKGSDGASAGGPSQEEQEQGQLRDKHPEDLEDPADPAEKKSPLQVS